MNNPLLCFLCNKKFQRPKILDCLHNYCQKCLQDMQKSNKSSEKIIRCPICRQITQLSDSGVSGTKTNYFLVRLVEEATTSEILKNKTGRVSCSLCRVEASSGCYDCAKFLCSGCESIHSRLPVSTEHDVYSLDECREGKLPGRSADRQDGILKCPNHAGEKCRFFCQTCQELICRDCTVLDYSSSNSHKYTDLQTAASAKRQSTKILISQLEEKVPDLETSLKVLGKIEPALKTYTEEAKANVQAIAKKIQEEVKAEETRLLREIRHESSNQIKELKEMQKTLTASLVQARFSLQAAKVFVQASLDSEFLWLQSALVKNLEDLVLREKPSAPHAVKFKENGDDIRLGQLEREDITENISKEVALENMEEKEKSTRKVPPRRSPNVQPKKQDTSHSTANLHHKLADNKSSSRSSNSEGENFRSTRSTKSEKPSISTKLSSSTDHDGKLPRKPPTSLSSQKTLSSDAVVQKTKDDVQPSSDRVLRSSSRANTVQINQMRQTLLEASQQKPPKSQVKNKVTDESSNLPPAQDVSMQQSSSSSSPKHERFSKQPQAARRDGGEAMRVRKLDSDRTHVAAQRGNQSHDSSFMTSNFQPLMSGQENSKSSGLVSSTNSNQAVDAVDGVGNQIDTDSDDSDL